MAKIKHRLARVERAISALTGRQAGSGQVVIVPVTPEMTDQERDQAYRQAEREARAAGVTGVLIMLPDNGRDQHAGDGQG